MQYPSCLAKSSELLPALFIFEFCKYHMLVVYSHKGCSSLSFNVCPSGSFDVRNSLR
jgi:hypothetical protein